MAAFFTIGEQKTRPGVYLRYENTGSQVATATDGICAAVIRSNWGATGSAVLLEYVEDIGKYFGEGGTTDIVREMFKGGAKGVYVSRLGTEGTRGIAELENEAGETAVKLTLLHTGSRGFQIIVRESLEDETLKELVFLEGTSILQRLQFPASGTDETEALMDAFKNYGSEWFTLEKTASGVLKVIGQTEIPPGDDPTVNVSAYSDALSTLEPYRWNVIGLDTNDCAIQTLLHSYLNRIYGNGSFVMGVVGGETAMTFSSRIEEAKKFNDYKLIYVGSGFKDASGKVYEGCMAAARVAGMIAGTPSNQDITHKKLPDAIELTEVLKNTEHTKAIKNGLLTFSISPKGICRIESAINTFTAPDADNDAGWSKIKRTKIRFELFQRINDSVEEFIGKINNDADGQSAIIQEAQGVCNTMISERKLHAGASVSLKEAKGDSAWFTVSADDIDSLEKMYFTFHFRFAPEE